MSTLYNEFHSILSIYLTKIEIIIFKSTTRIDHVSSHNCLGMLCEETITHVCDCYENDVT